MKLILNDDGNWFNPDARFTPNTIFEVYIEKFTSRFDKGRTPKYLVVVDGTNHRSYRVDFAIKSFDSPQAAAAFAAKFARLINEEN